MEHDIFSPLLLELPSWQWEKTLEMEMAYRTFDNLLQYGEIAVRRAVRWLGSVVNQNPIYGHGNSQ